MVRRGSTVRVRQRAYLEPRSRCKSGFFVADQDTLDHLLAKEGVDRRRRRASTSKSASSRGLRQDAVRAARSGDRFWGHNRSPLPSWGPPGTLGDLLGRGQGRGVQADRQPESRIEVELDTLGPRLLPRGLA